MSYGTGGPRARRLEPDPTVIPSTSALGFLGRLPFKLGGTLRYKPSAADLQEHPGARVSDFRDGDEEEGEPLIPDEDEEHEGGEGGFMKGHNRQRSSTASSGETSDSFRSRGDLFPSDGEDDAVPLSDEFAMVLERRTTNSNTDDRSSGKTRSSKGKKPAGSRNTSRNISRTTASSQSRPPLSGHRTNSGTSLFTPDLSSPEITNVPSLSDLQREEERVRLEEDKEVERKREAAAKLAMERGLHKEENTESISESKGDVEDVPPPEDINIEEGDEGTGVSREENRPVPRESQEQDFVPARLPNFK